MVTLTENEWNTLKTLQNNHPSRLVQIPSDEPMIDIDLDSRTIILPVEFQDFISLERDHRAETVYFRCDRFFDNVDLSKTTIVIEYINAAGEGRIYPVVLKDIESEEGKIIFDWCIGADATKVAGNIQFAVHFYSVDQEKAVYTYSLRTRATTATIYETLNEIDTDEEYNYSAATLDRLMEYINTATSDAQITWVDL